MVLVHQGSYFGHWKFVGQAASAWTKCRTIKRLDMTSRLMNSLYNALFVTLETVNETIHDVLVHLTRFVQRMTVFITIYGRTSSSS